MSKMTDKEKIASLRRSLYWERDNLTRLRNQLNSKSNEHLELLRQVRKNFDGLVDLIAEGKTPCIKSLIRNFAQMLGARNP